jgi:hypothetical protein
MPRKQRFKPSRKPKQVDQPTDTAPRMDTAPPPEQAVEMTQHAANPAVIDES